MLGTMINACYYGVYSTTEARLYNSRTIIQLLLPELMDGCMRSRVEVVIR